MKATPNVLANLVDYISEGTMLELDQEELTPEQKVIIADIAAKILKSVPDLTVDEVKPLIDTLGESYAGVSEMTYAPWPEFTVPDEDIVESLKEIRS